MYLFSLIILPDVISNLDLHISHLEYILVSNASKHPSLQKYYITIKK